MWKTLSGVPTISNGYEPLEPEIDVSYVGETIKILSKECPVPVIGFAGAPFTVASYLIEGKPSRSLEKTKALMEEEPEIWDSLWIFFLKSQSPL